MNEELSELEAGLAATPFAVGSATGSALGGRYVNRFGRPLIVAGLSVLLLADRVVTMREGGIAADHRVADAPSPATLRQQLLAELGVVEQ